MELFPIGTIIKMQEKKFCIIGYSCAKKEEKTQGGYFIVPYPLGYIDAEKSFFVSAASPVEVISYGYQSKTSKELVKLLGIYYGVAQEIGEEKTAAIFKAYQKAAQTVEEKK